MDNTSKGGKMKREGNNKFTLEECHKNFAIELNNLVWKLLSKLDRTDKENNEMINAAHASLYHWSKIGEAVNLQRGEWLISRVYAVLNRSEPAVYHAKNCLELTRKHNLIDFDLAFSYEGMARAYATSGKREEALNYIKLAEKAGKEIKNKKDREIFFSDFESEPWYGVQ